MISRRVTAGLAGGLAGGMAGLPIIWATWVVAVEPVAAEPGGNSKSGMHYRASRTGAAHGRAQIRHATQAVRRAPRDRGPGLTGWYSGYEPRTKYPHYRASRGDAERRRQVKRENNRPEHRRHRKRHDRDRPGYGYAVLPAYRYPYVPGGYAYVGDEYYEYDDYEYDDVAQDEPVTRASIEMIPVRVVERKPSQRPVMKTVTLPDGTVRTIITSEPIPRTLGDGWSLLAAGDASGAAEIFARERLDETHDAEATLGYGLALALQGDDEAAATAFRAAREDDPAALESVELSDDLRVVVEQIRTRYVLAADAPGRLIVQVTDALLGGG